MASTVLDDLDGIPNIDEDVEENSAMLSATPLDKNTAAISIDEIERERASTTSSHGTELSDRGNNETSENTYGEKGIRLQLTSLILKE